MRKGATSVAFAGALSRLAGLVRERLFARYLGTSDFADAYSAAMRIPGLMESVMGDRVFASAFIPRYSRLLSEGADREARHLARSVGLAHLTAVVAVVVAGVLAAPLLVGVIASGFESEKAALTVRIVRILFPTMGLIVMGAWCLAVLNSHRRFFLPYAAPIISAIAISTALVVAGRTETPADIAVAAAWGALIGALLQLLVQLPFVFRAIGRGDDTAPADRTHRRAVGKNIGPTAVRGVVQRLGMWIEVGIAGFLSTGAIAGLEYARMLYGLPFTVFTVSIAAALLPEISSTLGGESESDRLVPRLNSALRHAAFLLIPCAVAFITLGDVIAGAVYQNGAFTGDDARYVWAILGALGIGLVGSSMGGMYATAFYALGDTMTPLRAALVRLALRVAMGVTFAIPVTRAFGLDPRWGAAGLGAAIGISGWLEFALLRLWLFRRLGSKPERATGAIFGLWGIALSAGGVAWIIKLWLPELGPIATAVPVLGSYAVVYLLATSLLGFPESKTLWSQLRTVTRS